MKCRARQFLRTDNCLNYWPTICKASRSTTSELLLIQLQDEIKTLKRVPVLDFAVGLSRPLSSGWVRLQRRPAQGGVRRDGPQGDPHHPEPAHRHPQDQGQLPQEAGRCTPVLPASEGDHDLGLCCFSEIKKSFIGFVFVWSHLV